MPDKIVLIRPRNVYNYNNYPPLNLILLASKLRSAGFPEVKIINCAFEKDQFATLEKELEGALFAGVSLLTSEAPDAYEVIKFIKQKTRVPVVAGGWHCTLFPEQMAGSELIDYVIAGEGEDHIVEIASALKAGRKIEKKIFPKTILDMETLPLPDYGFEEHIERFINSYLTDKLSESVRQPMRWLPYESSRGCPSRCTFCINVVTDNRRYRKKSATKVLSEIEHLVKTHRLTHLKILDDNFFVDCDRVRAVCSGLIELGLNITWDGECRVDYFNDTMLNDETLELARRSGLVQMTLGIESGSPKTLGLMKKGITPAQAEHAVKKCSEHGIIPRSSFILEIPGEGLADIKQTIAFINKLRFYPLFTCGVGTFRPYPKCELTEQLLKEGYLTEPSNFEAWTSRDVIDMYTASEYIRPWQVNGKFSESAAYYLNMESESRIGNHQLDRRIDRLINNAFILIARLRNRFMFYHLPIDKLLFKSFLTGFYRRRAAKEGSR